MGIFDEIAAEQANPYSDLNIQAPTRGLSLLELKQEHLAEKVLDKRDKLNPESTVDALTGGSDPEGSLLDMAESSLYQGAGRIHDFVGSGINKIFGTDIDVDPLTGLSNQELADREAGFTGRARYNQDVEALSQSISEADSLADWLRVAGQGALLGPRALADSANTAAELAIGTIGTGGLGLAAKGVQLGSKLFRGADHISDAATAALDVKRKLDKTPSFLSRVKGGAKAVGKNASRTSLMTADLTEGMRQDYIREHGTEPPPSWYALNVPITMALNAVEFGIITRLAPKMDKGLIKEMKEAVGFMSHGQRLSAANRIFRGIGKVVEGAGAEAGQEYLQSWHEILATKVKGDDLNAIARSVLVELGVPENRVDATLGLVLGGAAGGTARGIAIAPQTAVGVTADVAKGTVKTVAKTAQKAKDKASLRILPESERQTIAEEHAVRKEVVDEKVADFEAKAKTVDEATTLDDLLQDPEIRNEVEKEQREQSLSDEDLADETNLASIKDKVSAKFKADAAVLVADLEASNIAKIAAAAGKNIKNKSVEKAKALLKDVPVEQLVEQTKDLGKKTVAAVKELRSSTARGVVDMGLRNTKDASKVALKAAEDLEVEDLQKVIGIVGQKNEWLGRQLKKLLGRKEKAQSNFRPKKNLQNKDNLNKAVAQLAEDGKLPESQTEQTAAINELINTVHDNFEDLESVETVEKALDIVEKSGSTKISKKNLEIYRNKLEAQAQKNGRPGAISKALDNFADKVDDAGGLIEYLKDTKAVELTVRALKATGATDFIKKIKEKLPDLPDNDEELDAALEEAFDKADAKVRSTVKKTKEFVAGKDKVETETETETEATGTAELEPEFASLFAEIDKALGEKPQRETQVVQRMETDPKWDLIQMLLDSGFSTPQDLNSLQEQYPNIWNSDLIMDELMRVISDNEVTNQETDSVAVKDPDEEAARTEYKKRFKGCPA